MPDPSPTTAGRSSSVQSVARAIALLRCFEDAGPELSLTDLARATGLNLSTAHRLAATLVEGGMLARDPGNERYHVGPTLVALARSATAPAQADRATAILESLTRRTSESASLGVGDGRNVVVLVCVESRHALRFDRPPGTLVPAHASAMGKALLAFGVEPPASAVKALAPLERFTPRTLTSQRALVADLEVTRDRGYALIDEEQTMGVRSLAVPVLGTDGFAVAAVGIQGPVSRIGDDRIAGVAAAVGDTARAIEVLTQRGYLL
jgi:IclR family transcriptional regulator, acetate operon repressor